LQVNFFPLETGPALARHSSHLVGALFAALFVIGQVLAAIPANAAEPTKPTKPAVWLEPDRTTPNGTHYATFTSKVLNGQEVSYLIYLPQGYDQGNQRYPVIYWLHPWGGDQQVGAKVFLPYVQAAINEKVMPPVIVVLPNGMRQGDYLDMPNGQKPVESVIIQDLIPHIDGTYRTIPKREARIIEGFSMGGFGAGHLGFKYPELFGTVVINAGAMVESTWRPPGQTPKDLAGANADKLRGHTRIHIGSGSIDDLLPRNQELHERLQQLTIDHEYQVVPEVGHNAFLYYKTVGPKFFDFHRKSLESVAPDR
jgi:endo-1,4-beta-xylanase